MALSIEKGLRSMAPSLNLTRNLAEALCGRVDESSLAEGDRTLAKACIRNCFLLGEAYAEKSHTVDKLLRMIFGPKTEKASKVIGLKKPKEAKPHAKGHGRNGTSSYRSKKAALSHASLKKGDTCPGCQKGKVYPAAPGVAVRIEGVAPLTATSYECEKLRCNLCGEVFSASAPGGEKYDATAGAMIALLKYGTGLPFNRLEALQESLGIPLPASTQWDIIEKNARPAHPAYRELVRQAAQGEIIHNDDTAMKVLLSINEKEGRKGTFTTGMLSVKDERKIALFVTGHHHAGENLAELLAKRHKGLDPPIQMCDALSRNAPKEFVTILGNCLSHGRRNFVDQAENFPEECRHVIEVLAKVYTHDATTKKMPPPERLAYHKEQSGPLMEDLRTWMHAQFEEKKTEPNSGLGKAFSYMLNHWEPLTLFLRVERAPLDNNICEQALKMAIRHRKNSLFYRTLHGAYIGDLFMSLIHTCRLSKVNPLNYLVALQRHSHKVFKNPEEWLPWNYEASVAAASQPP
jgi:transposase